MLLQLDKSHRCSLFKAAMLGSVCGVSALVPSNVAVLDEPLCTHREPIGVSPEWFPLVPRTLTAPRVPERSQPSAARAGRGRR